MTSARQQSESPQEVRIERIVRNATGQIEVFVSGRDDPIADARVARCFPWSLPECYVSIRDKDGKEVVLLKSVQELDPASRQLVLDELHDKVFNPKIQRVLEHKNDFGVISITADTDRGRVTFQVRSRDDIRFLTPTQALFRDADGNVYELADVTRLDPASRKWLAEYF